MEGDDVQRRLTGGRSCRFHSELLPLRRGGCRSRAAVKCAGELARQPPGGGRSL